MSLEEHWEQSEVERRREWAELEGRFVTAEAKRQTFDDELFLKVNAVNAQFLEVLHEINASLQQLRAEMRQEFGEVRAEQRASREALLAILDRLPPPRNAAG